MAKPTESFGEVIHQYTDTLCTTQKQTSLTNSLLQDIAVFNEYDFTKVEDWLTDIETAGDLTNESQAKLAKAKARGLTHTLATKQSFLTSLGKKLRIYYDSNCATLIFIPIPCVLWIFNSRKRNPLQHMSTDSNPKQGNAISQMMLPLLGFLSKD